MDYDTWFFRGCNPYEAITIIDDYDFGYLPAQKEETSMKKNWYLPYTAKCYDTLQAATDAAKKYASSTQKDIAIYEMVAYTKSPIPDIEVVTVTA